MFSRFVFCVLATAMSFFLLASCSGGGGSPGSISFVAGQAFVVSEDGTPSIQIVLSRVGGSSGSASVVVTPTGITATGGTPPLAPPADFDATPITVNFADGDATDKVVTIPILDDGVVEPDETLTLMLSSPIGASLGSFVFATLTIANNDFFGAIEFASSTSVYNEDGTIVAPIVVRRIGGVAGSVSATFATADGTANSDSSSPNEPVDYAHLTTSVVFGDGDGADKTVFVTLVADGLPELDETITLSLSAPAGGAELGATTTATLTIIDDDVVLALGPAPNTGAAFGSAIIATSGKIAVGRPGVPPFGDVLVFDPASAGLMNAIPAPEGPPSFGSTLEATGADIAIGSPTTIVPRVFVMNPLTGALRLTITSAFQITGLGRSLATDGGFLFVGAPTYPNGGNGGRVIQVDLLTGSQPTFFTGVEPGDNEFGSSLLASNGVVYVGAPATSSGNTSGRVFGFNIATGLQSLLILNPFPSGGAEHMGLSLEMFGGLLCAGAPDHDAGATNTGRVYLFDPTNGAFVMTLEPPAPEVPGGRFGRNLQVVRDRLVVQQPGGGPLGAGRLFVFDASGALVQTIDHPNPTAGADFGAAMDEFDGQLLVGAPLTDTSGFVDSGAAYVVKID